MLTNGLYYKMDVITVGAPEKDRGDKEIVSSVIVKDPVTAQLYVKEEVVTALEQYKIEEREQKDKEEKRKSILERLGINMVSIVIGALFFLSAIAWIDLLRAISDNVFDESMAERKNDIRKSLINAILVTLIAIVSVIGVYTYYNK